jgi:outer membrane protein assembly factor BamB
MKIKSGVKKIAVFCAAAACCYGLAFGTDWLTDGGNNQRTGWNQEEKTLTKDNIKTLKLLWKTATGNDARALHSLGTPLVVDKVPMPGGAKQVVYVGGVSDNLYAIDATNGKILWQRHYSYTPPPARGGGFGGPQATPQDPKHNNFLQPGGSSDTPVIGPADASGDRTLYVDDGGGNLHSIDIVSGEDEKPTTQIGHSKFALQLYNNMIIYGAIYTQDTAIVSLNINDPNAQAIHTSGFGRSGGLWGRRGPTIDSTGTVWTTTGDGNVDTSNPDSLILANSVVGFRLSGDSWKIENYFTPPNWAWLWHRDLDPNNTPTIFTYKGKELMAASGKECRVYLLDPRNPGGADHHTPLYKTPLFCNVDADFQNAGSWGALTSWEDSSGNRYVVVPFWGPSNPDVKFPLSYQPTPAEGGEATFKLVDNGGNLTLQPLWISHDMHRGEPNIVANGMVFSYGSGENTQQAWPDIGLNFDSTIRAAHSGHATIYVLDGLTGKELWNSGDTITNFNHFSGITVANGHVYLGTYDGELYCFGLPSQATSGQ